MRNNINNTRIKSFIKVPSPNEVFEKLRITEKASETVYNTRGIVQDIIDGADKRKLVITGPCSIHDYDEALEYAKFIKNISDRVADKLVLIMRTYFEKPRTTIGWKGLVYDPYLDSSYDLNKGINISRKLLIDINGMGVPAATEVLGPIVIQYYSDLISWCAIGARTTESQTHRELASGLSMPVGFKNGTQGNLDVAINAIKSCLSSHYFMGMDQLGNVSIVKTSGNKYGHIILRGGENNTNFSSKDIRYAGECCKEHNIKPRIIVDCSHANSYKNHRLQSDVWENVWGQINDGDKNIVGLMLESNLKEGNQKISSSLKYGVSVTDSCIGLEETEELIMGPYNSYHP